MLYEQNLSQNHFWHFFIFLFQISLSKNGLNGDLENIQKIIIRISNYCILLKIGKTIENTSEKNILLVSSSAHQISNRKISMIVKISRSHYIPIYSDFDKLSLFFSLFHWILISFQQNVASCSYLFMEPETLYLLLQHQHIFVWILYKLS